ncbi:MULTISPECIES: hypothetical protein [unclassified Acinetobacter]|uniref:hypothetical protein n=1 Tax=unclassified Acinetobacter TaxID=196816 RepID=UPI0015D3B8A9|nr:MULTISPECIES: hypothetical protein [unclassified Acinetobacter]
MDIQEAIEVAKAELLRIFAAEKPKSIRLEEVELDDSRDWVITLSYLHQADPSNDVSSTLGLMAIAAALNSNTRSYKKVIINKNTGQVESIKIHKNG